MINSKLQHYQQNNIKPANANNVNNANMTQQAKAMFMALPLVPIPIPMLFPLANCCSRSCCCNGATNTATTASSPESNRSSTSLPTKEPRNTSATTTASTSESNTASTSSFPAMGSRTITPSNAFLRRTIDKSISTGATKEDLNKLLQDARKNISELEEAKSSGKPESYPGYYDREIKLLKSQVERLENAIKTYDSQEFKDNAKTLIQQAMNNEVTSSTADDFINNNITPEILKYATAEQKSHMLNSLIDGKTDNKDSTSILNILQSVKSKSEMENILSNTDGGANMVLFSLGEDNRRQLIEGLKNGGKNGNEILLSIINNMDEKGPDNNPWNQVIHDTIKQALANNPELLKNASPEDKAMLLDKLMDGKTRGDAENSMLEILKSIPSKAIMLQVLELAGGYDRVVDELEEKKYNLYEGLS